MIEFIKNIFVQPTKKSDKLNAIVNSIYFDLDNDDHIHFDIETLDRTDETAQKIGLMLYMINEGHYVQNIINSLDTLVKTPEHSRFAQQIIHTWSQQISKDSKNQEEPVVSPSSFNIK